MKNNQVETGQASPSAETPARPMPPLTPEEYNNPVLPTAGDWIVQKWPTKYADIFTYSVIAPRGWMQDDGTFHSTGVACGLDSAPDAYLIASAPALLAALKLVVAHGGKITGGDLKNIRDAIQLTNPPLSEAAQTSQPVNRTCP